MTPIKNNYCSVNYDKDNKKIRWKDLIDLNNEPSFFTQSERWLDKAFNEIQKEFGPNTKMWDVIDILKKYNIKVHQYCAID